MELKLYRLSAWLNYTCIAFSPPMCWLHFRGPSFLPPSFPFSVSDWSWLDYHTLGLNSFCCSNQFGRREEEINWVYLLKSICVISRSVHLFTPLCVVTELSSYGVIDDVFMVQSLRGSRFRLDSSPDVLLSHSNTHTHIQTRSVDLYKLDL